MSNFVRLDLKTSEGGYIHYNKDYLEQYKDDLVRFLEDKDEMRELKFAKKMMMSQEIKSNNTIEGINDDLSLIDEVIKNRHMMISEEEKKRIINLYHGYQYILNHTSIDKESLKELYTILSEGLLEENDLKNMGNYYRKKPVYIYRGNRLDIEPYMGIHEDKIEYYMNQFFEYVNSKDDNSEIDTFIKSQIMHFYFVYIHPYFDVNGRTSRTVSMWYLLNHQSYPYIIFNRAIAFSKRAYEENIIKGRMYGDVTLFLKYMLIHVQKELEKEYVIHNIKEKANTNLSKEDLQILEYFLTMKGNLTAKDLATMYNRFNEHRRLSVIVDEKIIPLVEKNILINTGYTKSFINNDMHNLNLRINSNYVDFDKEKIKYLKLDKFIK